MTLLFSTGDWVNSISAIAALITAIITLFTVFEIKKQREHSYHPDISVTNLEFYVYKYDIDPEEEFTSIYLYHTKSRMREDETKGGYNELTIDINNIGLAVAKQIYYEWDCDVIEIYRALKAERSFINWVVKDRDLFVTVPELNVDWIYDLVEENAGGYFNFILPYSIENRVNEIKIPQYFLDLYWLYKVKTFLPDCDESPFEFPPLSLSIIYTDIHGKEIQKTFLLYLAYSFISNPSIEKSELAKFRIEIFEAST